MGAAAALRGRVGTGLTVKRHPELTPRRHEELTPLGALSTVQAARAVPGGTALSVSPKAARRLDAGQLVEIEIDDRLQRLAGGAVAQRLGHRFSAKSATFEVCAEGFRYRNC